MPETIQLFQASLSGVQLDSEGLAPRANPVDKLNRIAELADATLQITNTNACTPEHMLAHRLAMLTRQLLTTALMPGSPELVKSWLMARAELLELQAQIRENANRPGNDLE